jgi:hypothetical protein
MRSRLIEHNGEQIFLAAYSNLALNGFEEEIKAATAAICAHPPGSLKALIDVRNLLASPEVIKLFLWSANQAKPHICKMAVVGIGPSKPRQQLLDLVLRTSGMDGKAIEDFEDAKDWLAED